MQQIQVSLFGAFWIFFFFFFTIFNQQLLESEDAELTDRARCSKLLPAPKAVRSSTP